MGRMTGAWSDGEAHGYVVVDKPMAILIDQASLLGTANTQIH